MIEKGSISSFLSGEAYKRSKYFHQLLVLAMEIFHLNSYQLTLEEEGVLEIENLKIYIFTNEIQSVDKSSIPEKFVGIFDKYESYRNKNRNETAQFWFAYVEMVQLYHQFTRSIRMGDLHLYIHSLHNISSLFFTFNHHNYAQWLVVCHNNFLNMQKTHPQVYEDFRKGCFAIKRTSKQFPRVSVDLTLEQAFNADAACQRAGISALTNSISARQRWAQSHSIRVSAISRVFEEKGRTRKEDMREELKSHRMNGNFQDLEKLINRITETVNTYSGYLYLYLLNTYLFNIATGKAAHRETATILLDAMETGRKARDQFIEDCVKDSGRFSRPIKRQKIKSFATQAGRFKVTSASDKKLVTVTMTRDLFGSILFHALQAKVDMGKVLRYPLTPVLLSLCHPDGTMQNTPKSKLLVELENCINSCSPGDLTIDVKIVDGMFFLHLFVDLSLTFGSLAKLILQQVSKQRGTEIHLIFDKTISPSIKDSERNERDDNRHVAYQITGAEQKRTSNWLRSLHVDQFKEA